MQHDVSGVIPIDKPSGVSSRRVVDSVARGLGMSAVGHAGTLDPLACGVVVVCAGHATKLVDFLHELPKAYSATFLFGRSSPSDDLETAVEEERDPIVPDRDAVELAARRFQGDILQRPCDYSAVHVDGKRAYRLARKGREMVIPPKRVRIDRLVITGYEWPRLAIDVVCSSGTFIRAIGRDLAAECGTKAVMESLVRTAIGPFTRRDSLPLDAVTADSIRAALLPPLAAVPHLPRFMLADDMLARATQGALLDIASLTPTLAAVDRAGELVGILKQHASGAHRLRPNFRGRGDGAVPTRPETPSSE
ncbi:MAG: tRNA pseudouridine(55) synthase TruB [Planctomycetia bacterium]